MVLPEPYISLSDSRDTSCAIRFFSEPVPQLRDSWDNTWCYRKPRRYCKIVEHYHQSSWLLSGTPSAHFCIETEGLCVKSQHRCEASLRVNAYCWSTSEEYSRVLLDLSWSSSQTKRPLNSQLISRKPHGPWGYTKGTPWCCLIF